MTCYVCTGVEHANIIHSVCGREVDVVVGWAEDGVNESGWGVKVVLTV